MNLVIKTDKQKTWTHGFQHICSKRKSPRVKSYLLWWPNLRSHAVSLPLYFILEGSYKVWLSSRGEEEIGLHLSEEESQCYILRDKSGMGYMLVQPFFGKYSLSLQGSQLAKFKPSPSSLTLNSCAVKKPHSHSDTLLRGSKRPLIDTNYPTL